MFAGQENWAKWYRWGKKTTTNLFMCLNICFFQIKLQELRGFLFASQNVLTGVMKCTNSPCKTWLAHFICASYCSKETKRITWGFIWLCSHGHAARLISVKPKEEMTLTALSRDVWSTGLQANPCCSLWFKREKSEVILSLINTNI